MSPSTKIFDVQVGHAPEVEEEGVLFAPDNIPAGDVPYYLECDTDKDTVKIIFEYGSMEKERDQVTAGNVVVYFGMKTGRIYQVQVRNASQSKPAVLFSLLTSLVLQAQGRARAGMDDRGRISRNIELGRNLTERTLEKCLMAS